LKAREQAQRVEIAERERDDAEIRAKEAERRASHAEKENARLAQLVKDLGLNDVSDTSGGSADV
jgi:galactokinase